MTPLASPFEFHRHHIHPFALNCESQLASIYTFPLFSCSGGGGGDLVNSQLALMISCTCRELTSSEGVEGEGDWGCCWFAVPLSCPLPISISTTCMGWSCGAVVVEPRLPSIISTEVVVVGVVGAFEENRMLYGWRFVNF